MRRTKKHALVELPKNKKVNEHRTIAGRAIHTGFHCHRQCYCGETSIPLLLLILFLSLYVLTFAAFSAAIAASRSAASVSLAR